jgi:hypothetical protein
MRQSGLAELVPSLREPVYVGVSGGSMALAPQVGEEFIGWRPPTGGDTALGVVDFSLFPHLDHEALPDNCLANAQKWAARIPGPGAGIRDGRSDRDPGNRRLRRGHLRGALEAIFPVGSSRRPGEIIVMWM